eukprot:2825882-Heterocapsa_arctica.AAC.1
MDSPGNGKPCFSVPKRVSFLSIAHLGLSRPAPGAPRNSFFLQGGFRVFSRDNGPLDLLRSSGASSGHVCRAAADPVLRRSRDVSPATCFSCRSFFRRRGNSLLSFSSSLPVIREASS